MTPSNTDNLSYKYGTRLPQKCDKNQTKTSRAEIEIERNVFGVLVIYLLFRTFNTALEINQCLNIQKLDS